MSPTSYLSKNRSRHLLMRFRFTIRDLLWLTVVVAVLVVWWVYAMAGGFWLSGERYFSPFSSPCSIFGERRPIHRPQNLLPSLSCDRLVAMGPAGKGGIR